MTQEFKKCTSCGHLWQSRKQFLEDRATDLIGYQVNFDTLSLGFFLFNHEICGTTLGIPASRFKDLYNGPVYTERFVNTEQCPQYCLHQNELKPCPLQCECAWVREVIQVVRHWPKNVQFL